MRELVIISGKGGTGKTSLTASFAALAASEKKGGAVLADCDVDAADLHLILTPKTKQSEDFWCGNEAIIRTADCTGCGVCFELCRFDAIIEPRSDAGKKVYSIDPTGCEGCGVCVWNCPVKAIDFPERLSGEWFVSETRFGVMVHAKLIPGGENSGKLVSKVREEARKMAEQSGAEWVIVDGPPGVGCAVIAAIGGAARVLIVTEPTLSGEHDMVRVLQLAKHFKVPAAVCVNKWDLNSEMTEKIENTAQNAGAAIAGRVRYDRSFTAAQLQEKAVVEVESGALGDDIRAVWEAIKS